MHRLSSLRGHTLYAIIMLLQHIETLGQHSSLLLLIEGCWSGCQGEMTHLPCTCRFFHWFPVIVRDVPTPTPACWAPLSFKWRHTHTHCKLYQKKKMGYRHGIGKFLHLLWRHQSLSRLWTLEVWLIRWLVCWRCLANMLWQIGVRELTLFSSRL